MKKRQQGFSLIELMISLAISLLLIGMILSVFINSLESQKLRNAIGAIQENSRFASHFFSRDFRSLGFWGCLEGGETSVNILGNAGGAIRDQLSTTQGSLLGIDAVAGDSIEFVTLLDQSIRLTTNMSSTADNVEFDDSHLNLAVGDELLIGDCQRADLFTISKITGDVFEHKQTTNANGNTASHLSYPYKEHALVYPLVKVRYYLADSNGSRTLFRHEESSSGSNLPLVSDVEDMQILYGLANSDDELIGYMPESAIAEADFQNVISVRISLLLSSSSNVLPASVAYTFNGITTPADPTGEDRKMRRVFSETYTLRNRIN